MVTEPEGSTPPISKPTTGHNSQPVPATSNYQQRVCNTEHFTAKDC